MFVPVFPGIVEAVTPADSGFALILRQWAAAESDGDLEMLASLLDDDFRCNGAGGFVLTKQQWLDRDRGVRRIDGRYPWHLSEVAVRNGVAVAIGTHVPRAPSGGIETRRSFRVTLVAVDRGGRWQIVNMRLVPHPLTRPSRTSAATGQAPPRGRPRPSSMLRSVDANQRRN
jgi:hypothetical protein